VTEDEDPYADLKRHALTPERLAQLAATPTPRTKPAKKSRHFVKVPVKWIDQLAKARHIATYRLALYLLYRSWRAGGQMITVPNGALETEGVSRWQKWRALRELERLGLITVECRHRRSPRVALLL
jgi:hypothetical protein